MLFIAVFYYRCWRMLKGVKKMSRLIPWRKAVVIKVIKSVQLLTRHGPTVWCQHWYWRRLVLKNAVSEPVEVVFEGKLTGSTQTAEVGLSGREPSTSVIERDTLKPSLSNVWGGQIQGSFLQVKGLFSRLRLYKDRIKLQKERGEKNYIEFIFFLSSL